MTLLLGSNGSHLGRCDDRIAGVEGTVQDHLGGTLDALGKTITRKPITTVPADWVSTTSAPVQIALRRALECPAARGPTWSRVEVDPRGGDL